MRISDLLEHILYNYPLSPEIKKALKECCLIEDGYLDEIAALKAAAPKLEKDPNQTEMPLKTPVPEDDDDRSWGYNSYSYKAGSGDYDPEGF